MFLKKCNCQTSDKEYAKARYAEDIKRSLKENVPIPAICLYTGLSEEDIKEFSEED